jgi:hypothetical protein
MALGSENDIDQLELLLLPIYIANEHKDANEQQYAAMVWRTRNAEMNESSRAISCVYEGIAVRSVLLYMQTRFICALDLLSIYILVLCTPCNVVWTKVSIDAQTRPNDSARQIHSLSFVIYLVCVCTLGARRAPFFPITCHGLTVDLLFPP